MNLLWLVWALLWLRNVKGFPKSQKEKQVSAATPLLFRRDGGDPADFSFLSRWAAIGDSFTAGIGSGKQLGNYLSDDWKCSRYSYSWAQIVNHGLGGSISDFQFPACSGDRTEQIQKQAENLKGDLDLVMMTAGGNDLCLAAMIKECVFLPWRGEQVCQDVINKAQSNIDTILKPNIQAILDTLESKMLKDSIVIYNGYAPFFNTENEDCADPQKQEWAIREWWWISYWFSTPLPLNIERRKKFNQLVLNINKAIKEVVDDNDGKKKYRIAYSDWSEWPEIVDGQMCSPRDNGKYPNPGQPNMQFFKRNTYVAPLDHDQLKRRQISNQSTETYDEIYARHMEEMKRHFPKDDIDLYDSLIYKSPDPRAVALHQLDPRAPSPPNCPGDGGPDVPLGLGLPDSFLQNFHPNEKGHETIAASALETLVWMRAKILQQDACKFTDKDEFKCWSDDGLEWPRPYAHADRLNANYKDFCEHMDVPTNTINWSRTHRYNNDTPEEHDFTITLSDGASKFDKKECLDSFDRLINSCDTKKEEPNPMGWKFGGKWIRGDYTYEIYPTWQRPLIKRPDGKCNSHYHFLYSDYDVSGSGWAGYDFGKETILPALKGCMGLGVSRWKFNYCFKQSDCEGWEWTLSFRCPVFIKARCWDNLLVAKASAGYHHRYKGEGEKYEDFGCAGSDR